MKIITILTLCWLTLVTNAAEHKFSGLIDVSYHYVDGVDSHINGHYGKFRFDNKDTISVSQAIANYQVDFDNPMSFNTTLMAYADGHKDEIGLLETQLRYQGLPNQSGHRFNARAGIMYPKISLENNAIGWTSPATLTYSTMNSWIGEELRHAGLELNWDWLGKFHQSSHDFGLTASIFKNNDTVGTLLSWRGWTLSNRQTLWHEKLPLPPVKARFGGWLRFQAADTDPFIELDHRYGFEVNGRWQWQNRLKINVGAYDNNADTRTGKNGQFAWDTRFYHFGFKHKFSNNLVILGQFLSGDTLMTSPRGMTLVDNDYHTGYLTLRYQLEQQKFSVRFEEFSVTDNDSSVDDDNNEYGKAFTASYQYRLSKPLFIQAEFNWLNSNRPARAYSFDPVQLVERQVQLAARYYW
ncbi:hypothetical protein A9Q98_02630 [Thalassotalea sp. 42_200_T64]|nr:hypothetical protein A9Q98_02630 [Thalassotalea sp. 42_200_T64]